MSQSEILPKSAELEACERGDNRPWWKGLRDMGKRAERPGTGLKWRTDSAMWQTKEEGSPLFLWRRADLYKLPNVSTGA
jgi:hypothetical protein